MNRRNTSMKVTRNLDPQPSIIRKPPHRKPRTTAAGIRLKKDGAPVGKRSRPEAPLSKWKVNEVVKDVPVEDDSVTELTRKNGNIAFTNNNIAFTNNQVYRLIEEAAKKKQLNKLG